jgi:NDP-sugar pyrophosphorylase family protein
VIRPLILAAGEGKRMELQETPKPLVSVDGHVPLTGNAAMKFLNLGYKTEQVSVMVGYMADRIKGYLGGNFDYYAQEIIGDPTDGLTAWLRDIEKREGILSGQVSVLNCDDAAWLNENDASQLMRACDEYDTEGIMLSSVYEPAQHKFGFIPNNARVAQTCEGFSSAAGYVAGFFVINATKFLDYIEKSCGKPRNIVTYFHDRDLAADETITVVDDSPRICVNTRDALFHARNIYAQYHCRERKITNSR